MKKLFLSISFLILGYGQIVLGMEDESKPSYPAYLLNCMHPGSWYDSQGKLQLFDAKPDEFPREEQARFKAAADYIFGFSYQDIASKSPEEIEHIIIRVNTLARGLDVASKYSGSAFVVASDDTVGDYHRAPQNVKDIIDEMSGRFLGPIQQAPSDQVAKNIMQKFNTWWDELPAHSRNLLIGAGYYLAPRHEEIPMLMRSLAEYIIHALAKPEEIQANELADYVHMQLVKIHPFSDANGRTARLIVNLIEKLCGLQPTIFFSNARYTQAVTQSLIKKGPLADLLKRERAVIKDLEGKKWFDNPRFCGSCKAPALLKCSVCKSISYCSTDCQKKDWRSHKPICKKN